MSSDRKNAMSFESQQELEYLKQILKKLAGGRSRKQKEQQPTTPRSSSIQKLPKLTKQESVAGAKKDVGVTGLLSQRKRRTPTHFSPTMDGPTHYQTGGAQKGRRPLNILSQTMGFLPPLPPAPRGAKRFSFSQSSMGGAPVDLSFPQQAGFHYDIRDHPNPPTRFSPSMKGPTHYQTGGAQKGRRPLNILSQTMGFLPPLPPAPRGAKRFSFSQSSMGGAPVDLSFPQQAGFHYDIRDHPNPPTRFSPSMKGPTHFQTGGAKGGRRPIKITAQKQKDQTENPPPPPKAKGKGNKKFFPDL